MLWSKQIVVTRKVMSSPEVDGNGQALMKYRWEEQNTIAYYCVKISILLVKKNQKTQIEHTENTE